MLLRHARSLLFLPASNRRAIAKARTLSCDMVMLDLEDAVSDDRKEEARHNAVEAAAEGFGKRLCVVRINVEGTPWHGPEMVAVKKSAADFVILPKVENGKQGTRRVQRLPKADHCDDRERCRGSGGHRHRGGGGYGRAVHGHQ